MTPRPGKLARSISPLIIALACAIPARAEKPRIPGGTFTGQTPPDTMGTVGPNHLMVTVNGQVRFEDRSGNTLAVEGLSQFWQTWGALPGSDNGAYDPSAVYDPYNNRFIAVSSTDAFSSTSSILIGVSQTGDPTGSWYAWRVYTDQAGQIWADQTRVGFNRDWVVVSATLFDMNSYFQGSYVWVFRKSALYAGTGTPGNPTFTRLQYPQVPNDQVCPVCTYDNTLGVEYLAESDTGTGAVTLWRINGPVGSETMSRVADYASRLGGWAGSGPGGPQSGTGYVLDTGDDRILNGVYRNGSVWCAHNVFLPDSGPTRSAAEWWQLSTSSPGTVQQQGRVDDASATNFYAYPTIAVNQNNDALVGFSRFSATTSASAAYAIRRSTDPANTLQAPVVYQAGLSTFTYGSDQSGRCRWGDYSTAVVDPANDTDLWTQQEFVAAQDTWGTAWAQVTLSVALPSAPGQPVADVNPNTGTFNMSWAAATDAGGPGIAAYLPQRSADGGQTWTSLASQAGLTLPQTGMALGSYTYRVRAQDNNGNVGPYSPVSAAVSVVQGPSAPNPLSPSNGSDLATSSATLSWSASNDSSGVRNYDVQVSTTNTFSAIAWSATTSATTAATASLSDRMYYWEVRARDNSGIVSAWSAVSSFTVDTVPPTAPSATGPSNGGTVTTGRPTLTWTAASDATGVTYQVEVGTTNPIAAPLAAAISGLTSTQWAPPPLADGVYYWHVRAVDSAGNPGPWSPTWSFVVSGAKGFYVGVGAGGRGEMAPFATGSASYAARPLYTVPWSAYDSAVGETRPAAGDLRGDGGNEVVVGLGRSSISAGWILILSDSGSGFSIVRWLQVPWGAYDSANGETYPACGDIDGNGGDEIVVGLGTYTAAGGYFAIFGDANASYALQGWRQVNWPQYNAYDGQTRPAVGDVDGDGASEVFIGLGSYPSQGGYVYEFSDRTVTQEGRVQVAWPAYNAANGETWPACGDVDGDGTDEVCLGLGAYPASGGWVEYLKDANGNFAPLAWKQLPWSAYNAASGETRPSLGRMTTGSAQQTVIGLGKNAGALGYVAIYDRAPGFALLGWRQVSDSAYDGANGETRPSAGR